ncbi:SPW repeat domain-containing protein [Bradyrhizobium australiense]|nr:SPW repeat protein [Bradyrhizobium australiense]
MLAYINRGNAYRDSEQLDRAATNYGEVFKLAPTDARRWRNRGMIKLFQGNTRGGLADYDKARNMTRPTTSWNDRGQAKMRLGDKDCRFPQGPGINLGLRTSSENLQRLGAVQQGTRALTGSLRARPWQPWVGFLRVWNDIRRRGGRVWARYRKCCDCGRRRMPLFKGRFTMSGIHFFSKHRTWEDWFGMLLGVLIVVSPWFPFSSHDVMDAERSTMILNTFVVGMLVFGLAQLEYVALQRWEEVGEIALGLWLAASPFILGYAGDEMLRAWHVALGGIVVVLGALQLWQDWRLSDQELANHPQ